MEDASEVKLSVTRCLNTLSFGDLVRLRSVVAAEPLRSEIEDVVTVMGIGGYFSKVQVG